MSYKSYKDKYRALVQELAADEKTPLETLQTLSRFTNDPVEEPKPQPKKQTVTKAQFDRMSLRQRADLMSNDPDQFHDLTKTDL